MSDPTPADLEDLVAAARAASLHAYAPYSKFRVGASVRSEGGKTYTGCNVENATYGATLCAERVAIAKLVSAGERRVTAIAVVVDADSLAMPCGICLQTLAEFADEAVVLVAGRGELCKQTTLRQLLPQAFVLRPEH